ncbi:hypothetical protein BB381_04240 [Campylobacter pinnipediorum subsp. caledonicus]|uniref:autotransporter domain-containing protein n=1 Tax=Campylobacter pinnipediorum TaxID=1965231 RepID=UPI00099568EC|nr:autotransporter domain-containing protein [Campylobacter pinnipediorum]OPA70572.1 hypothetical protein BB381_04240 [Campylobacter pinnipediorum subsp. caledonicus]
MSKKPNENIENPKKIRHHQPKPKTRKYSNKQTNNNANKEAKKAVTIAIANNPANKLDNDTKTVFKALGDIASNELVSSLILDTKTKEGKQKTINFVKELTTSVKDTTNSLTTSSATDVAKFSSNLSTQTRLAKLTNLYNNDLALAYAINNLKDNKFADAGNGLSNLVKAYTDRFNNDNNVWGNIIGSKAKIKGDSSDTDSKVFGVTLGYDKAFDNVIASSYLSFAKAKTDSKIVFNADKKKKTYTVVSTGADFKLSEVLRLNINFGAKTRSKEKYYNGNIGLKYSF